MLFFDGGRQSGGHLISRVPVTSADEIFTILQVERVFHQFQPERVAWSFSSSMTRLCFSPQILRQQLTIRQLYRSCFPSAGDIDSSTAELGRPVSRTARPILVRSDKCHAELGVDMGQKACQLRITTPFSSHDHIIVTFSDLFQTLDPEYVGDCGVDCVA